MPEQIIIIDEKIDTFSELISSTAKDNRYELIQATTLQEGLLAVEKVESATVLISYKLGTLNYIEKLNQKNKKLYILLMTTTQLQFLDIAAKTDLLQDNVFYPIKITDIVDIQEKAATYFNELNQKTNSKKSLELDTNQPNSLEASDMATPQDIPNEEPSQTQLKKTHQEITTKSDTIIENENNNVDKSSEMEPLFKSVDVLTDSKNATPIDDEEDFTSKMGRFIIKADTNTNDDILRMPSAINTDEKSVVPSTSSDKNVEAKADVDDSEIDWKKYSLFADVDNENIGVIHNKYDNKPVIETNEPYIETNKSIIETNESNIETNKSIIETNESNIETNKSVIETNASIETNNPAIETNEPLIEANDPLSDISESITKDDKLDLDKNTMDDNDWKNSAIFADNNREIIENNIIENNIIENNIIENNIIENNIIENNIIEQNKNINNDAEDLMFSTNNHQTTTNNSTPLDEEIEGAYDWKASSLFSKTDSIVEQEKESVTESHDNDQDFQWNIPSIFKSDEEKKLETTFSKDVKNIDDTQKTSVSVLDKNLDTSADTQELKTSSINFEEKTNELENNLPREDNNSEHAELKTDETSKDFENDSITLHSNKASDENIQDDTLIKPVSVLDITKDAPMDNTASDNSEINTTKNTSENNIIDIGNNSSMSNLSSAEEPDTPEKTQTTTNEDLDSNKKIYNTSDDKMALDDDISEEKGPILSENSNDSKDMKPDLSEQVTISSTNTSDSNSENKSNKIDSSQDLGSATTEETSFNILKAVETMAKKANDNKTGEPEQAVETYNIYGDESEDFKEPEEILKDDQLLDNDIEEGNTIGSIDSELFDSAYGPKDYTTITEAEKLFSMDDDLEDGLVKDPSDQNSINKDEEDEFLNNLFGMLEMDENSATEEVENSTVDDPITEDIIPDLTDYENNILDYFIDSDDEKENTEDTEQMEHNDYEDEVFLKDLEDIAAQREEEEKANLSGLFDDLGNAYTASDSATYFVPKDTSLSYNTLIDEDDDLETNLKNAKYTKPSLPYIDNGNGNNGVTETPLTSAEMNTSNRSTEDSGFKRIANFISDDARDKHIFPKRAGTLSIDLSSGEIEDILTKKVDKAEIKSIIKNIVRETITPTVDEIVPVIAEKIVKEELEFIKSGR